MMNGLQNSADIHNLVVAHWVKPAEAACRAGLFLDTCQRQLSIQLSPDEPADQGAEIRSGVDAYRFVLEVTTGLRSAVPGETNVFGQFKEAWERLRPNRQVARLAPLVHRIINDTKAIRCTHLLNIGGASYGTLVRRLIRPAATDRILFVGTGKLARSMLPLFRNHVLGLWNHRSVGLEGLSIESAFGPGDGERAAHWADHVILTTPPDRVNDDNWRRWLAASDIRTVVHLGHRRGHDPVARGSRVRVFDLDDVFDLRRAQADIRTQQLSRARAACRQCATDFIRGDRNLPFASLKTA